MSDAFIANETGLQLHRLNPDEIAASAPDLATVLLDCVDGGASVSFMADLTRERAEAFWHGVAGSARTDGRILFVALDEDGVVGTVQMIPVTIDNQPHRAEISKMLVHRRGRRRGIGEALMRAAEDAARDQGRWLLTLDTMTGEAGDRLYRRLGWTAIGAIPDFALYPDGRIGDTAFFYKRL